MKIGIIINSFKPEQEFLHHEKLCVESLRKIKKQFNNVDLVSLIFEDENIILNDFENLNILKQHSKTIFPNFKKKLPFVNEIFDIAANLNYDYFIFINNDIIVSDRFIKQIINEPSYETFVASKLHFRKLDSLNDSSSDPGAISVHGFDGFAVKSSWWLQKRDIFQKFFLGKPYWDTYFFTMCYLHSKCKVLNKPPLSIFHVAHDSDAMNNDELTEFNTKSFQKTDYVGRTWFTYVYKVLLKRSSHNGIEWYMPFENEEELEKAYLKL